jgi:HlyD family secretion protein
LSHEEYETAKNDLETAESKLTTVRSSVRRAEAQVNVSQVTLKQTKDQYQATTSRVAQAQALLHKTKDLLDKTTIRSPLTGVITKLNVEAGERAVPGTLNNPTATLMEIADMSIIESEIQVDETDIVNVKVGQHAKVIVDALPDTPLQGMVTEVGNSALVPAGTNQSQQARDFKVVVQLADAPKSLRPGLSATAEITTATKNNVLTIPIQALTIRQVDLDANGNYTPRRTGQGSSAVSANGEPKTKKKELQGVFAISKEGKVIFRPVETGIAGDTEIEIKKGLSRDEEIIVGNYKALRNLKEGDSVRVDNSSRTKEEEKK